MITIGQMIQREVLCCMSGMVSVLAQSTGNFERADHGDRDVIESLNDLCAQAFKLASPVLDYEEAAIQAGWKAHPSTGPDNGFVREFGDESTKEFGSHLAESWEQACALDGLDPYEWEVYEHWAVSTWFAEQLLVQGERVDTGFVGLNIWARATTGQAISADGVVQKIYREMKVAAL